MIRRQIELLKLLSKQREYKPASFFSKSLEVSTKTIYTDITYLQSEVEKYKVDLVRAPRIGIRLEGESENIQDMLKDIQKDDLSEDEKYTPEYRRLWILKKILIDCERITLESVSQEFLVSKTSLYQDIAAINKSIEGQFGRCQGKEIIACCHLHGSGSIDSRLHAACRKPFPDKLV